MALLSARPAVTFPAAEHHYPWPIPSYTAWRQTHIDLNNLRKVVTQLCPELDLNPQVTRHVDRKSYALPVAP